MKNDRGWLPGEREADWIESLARPLSGALAAIEAAATEGAERIPIVDRDSGRVLAALAAGRRRIVEVGTAFGYSTLWLAIGQPARRDDRDDRPGSITDRSRPRPGGARPGSRTSGSRSSTRRRSRRSRPGSPPWTARSISRSSTPSSPSTSAYLEALVPRLAPGALVVADNVLWSGRVVDPARTEPDTSALRAFDAAVLARPAVPGHDPAGRRRPAHRRLPWLRQPPIPPARGRSSRPRPPVRDPARARRDARGPARPAGRRDRRRCLGRRRRAASRARAGPAVGPLRAQRRLRRAGDAARGRRRGRLHPAGERWRRRRPAAIAAATRTGSSRSRRRRSPGRSWPTSRTGSPRTRTGRSSGSSAGPGSRPARRRRARRPRPLATRAGRSSRSATRPTRRWRSGSSAEIADEIAERFGVERLAIVHRHGEVPLGEASIAIVARRRPPRRRIPRGPLRDRRDEGAGPDLEGRAVRATVTSGSASPPGPRRPAPRPRPNRSDARAPDGRSPAEASFGHARRSRAARPPARARRDAGRRVDGPGAGSTTVGRERALLRMFGISGLDAAGRPLAWAVVDRYLAGGPDRLGGGIVLPVRDGPRRVRRRPAASRARRRSGAVDLGMEASLLREPDRRAIAEEEAAAARRGGHRADRRRTGRPAPS